MFCHPLRSSKSCFRIKVKDCLRFWCRCRHDNTRSKQIIDVSDFPPKYIRNFGIIAHVDHGKSTIADRLLEMTGAIRPSSENKQVLDSLQVERERGITVKAQSASIIHNYDGKDYLLNLIDTPGHVDFSYEVSRSLAACQGVLLVVDATQGVQAQTLSNFYLAMEQGLSIIPILNKIDLKTANVAAVSQEMDQFFDIKGDEIVPVSAKTGQNMHKVLDAIVTRLPSPAEFIKNCSSDEPLRTIIFDSSYEVYKGVNVNLFVQSGCIKVGDRITSPFLKSLHKSKVSYEVKEIGLMRPHHQPTRVLYAGQVGYMFCGMKSISEAMVGDTFHHVGEEVEAFEGFKPAKPMVFGSFYPTEQSEYLSLKVAIDKLTLNDNSVTVLPSNSEALGAGFLLGFLGLLHMDVFRQRLEQEYDASLICASPTVPYKAILSSPSAIKANGGKELVISTASEFPDKLHVQSFLQPMVQGTIMAPAKFTQEIAQLCLKHGGEELDTTYLNQDRVILYYKLPLSDVIVGFYDELKMISSGYASFDYEDAGYEETSLVKVDITVNGTYVPELSTVFTEDKATQMGRRMCESLKENVPQHLFLITIHAKIGGKIIASERISAARKDVTAKLYGGDITRRMKLLRNQKEGKKRMREVGKVKIPKDAMIKVFQG